jgi:hypothetical protein
VDNACVDLSICVFPDPSLEALIRNEIGQPTGNILVEDLQGITAIQAWSQNIADITGIECLSNLSFLDLWQNAISDISPLSGLTNLTYLYLEINNISDISPVAGLSNLQQLYLNENPITDISPVAGLTNLNHLWFEGGQVSDISPVSGLTNLATLNMALNQVSDIGPISGLTNLLDLRFSGNQVSDISAVGPLTNLVGLSANSNQISDIGPVSGLTELSDLYLASNNIADILPLATNGGLDSGDNVDITSNFIDCGDSTSQSVIATLLSRGVNLDADCTASCVPSTDICVDSGYECGSAYHGDCPAMLILCGACANQTETCIANLCQPIPAGEAIFRCDGQNYGYAVCADFLEANGWTVSDAEMECDLVSPEIQGTVITTIEAGSCKDTAATQTPYAWSKRCVFTSFVIPEAFYLYMPSFFPDNVCNMPWGPEPAPWPVY